MNSDHLRPLVERLDAPVARALELAAAEAGRRGDGQVGVEHLLLELLNERPGADPHAPLRAAGVESERLREAIRRALPTPGRGAGRPVFSPTLLDWLEQGVVSAALHFGGRTVGVAALLQAGAGVRGEFEQRLREVLDAVRAAATPAILFIDEAPAAAAAG